MPFYDTLLELNGMRGESEDPPGTASTSTDPEWKYVNVRRSTMEEAGDLAAPAAPVEGGVGGWGSSQYQYADPSPSQAAGGGGATDNVVVDGRIITAEDFAFDADGRAWSKAAGTSGSGTPHGVSVLAWARVDGTGDVDGDGEPDVIVGPSTGGGPQVRSADATGTLEGDVDGNDFLIWNRHGVGGSGGVDDFPTLGLVQTSEAGSLPAFETSFLGGVVVGAAEADAAGWPMEQHSLNFEEIKVEAVPSAAFCPNCVLGDGSVRFLTDPVDPF